MNNLYLVLAGIAACLLKGHDIPLLIEHASVYVSLLVGGKLAGSIYLVIDIISPAVKNILIMTFKRATSDIQVPYDEYPAVGSGYLVKVLVHGIL